MKLLRMLQWRQRRPYEDQCLVHLLSQKYGLGPMPSPSAKYGLGTIPLGLSFTKVTFLQDTGYKKLVKKENIINGPNLTSTMVSTPTEMTTVGSSGQDNHVPQLPPNEVLVQDGGPNSTMVSTVVDSTVTPNSPTEMTTVVSSGQDNHVPQLPDYVIAQPPSERVLEESVST